MASNASPSEAIAQELLELHVQHELAQCEEKQLLSWIREESTTLFEWAREIKLNQLVSAQTINDVIKANVVERDIPGSIPEIAGEAASKLFTATMHKETTLGSLISTHEVEEFIDKALELKEQRKNGLNHIIDLPIYTDLISGVIYQAINRYIYDSNVLSKNIPGVSSMLKFGTRMVNKTVPKLEGAVEENVRDFIANNINFLIRESKLFLEETMTDEQLKSSAMELWDNLKESSFGDIQAGMDSLDLSEFVALGYDFWLNFRKTEYFQKSYELIVDYVFEKYGSNKLGDLLDDLEITPKRFMEEAERFTPLALHTLRESGQLEALIRRRLRGFYTSKKVKTYLKKQDV